MDIEKIKSEFIKEVNLFIKEEKKIPKPKEFFGKLGDMANRASRLDEFGKQCSQIIDTLLQKHNVLEKDSDEVREAIRPILADLTNKYLLS